MHIKVKDIESMAYLNIKDEFHEGKTILVVKCQ